MKTLFTTRNVEFHPVTYKQDLWAFHAASLLIQGREYSQKWQSALNSEYQ